MTTHLLALLFLSCAQEAEPGVNTWKTDTVVRRVQFSPDGRELATLDTAGKLSFRDAKTGRVLRSFESKAPVKVFALAPDGKKLAFADDKGNVSTVEFATRKITKLGSAEHGIHAISYSPDGNDVFAVAYDEIMRWNKGVAAKALRSRDLKESLQSVAVSPDGKTLIAGGNVTLNRGTNWTEFRVLDIATGNRTAKTSSTRFDDFKPSTIDHPAMVAISPDGKMRAGAGSDHIIYLFDDTKINVHTATITAMQFTPDGKYLLSAGYDGHVALIDTATKKPKANLSGEGKIHGMTIAPDGKRVIWATDKGLRVTSFAHLLKPKR